ncbi:aspartate aminotransferase family protein [candidate division NPL-UPA2 bacterium]|nr:aspartate aminotransferase family protein [candidate division NPL-UPA2 bacterium]
MNTKEIKELDKKFIINTYGERPLALVRGKGARVWDAEGRGHLDLFSGIGVNLLGYGHPQVLAAIREQIEKLVHVSNLYYTEPQVKLARLLSENSFGGKCFFSNSGAEANEAAIKLARKYAQGQRAEGGGQKGRYEIITARGSFHGRTLATLSATGQAKYQKGFDPLPDGFKYIPFNDIEAAREAINDKSCALMLEPIQGEGGDHIASRDYLTSLKELSDKHGFLLIFDEVQCGLGRAGKLFAYQHTGVEPDIMTLAKPLGGGLPLGAMLAREEVAAAFQPGDHASTFGGNPVACAAGVAVMEAILEENLLKNAVDVGNYLQQRLQELKQKYSFIREVRGRGLMSGIELNFAGKEVARECLERGLLINCTAETFVRFLPPLIITREEIDEGMAILDSVLKKT